MEEQIYQAVWCQVFATTCTSGKQDLKTIDRAKTLADWAAFHAVQKWNEAQRLAAIEIKKKENP